MELPPWKVNSSHTTAPSQTLTTQLGCAKSDAISFMLAFATASVAASSTTMIRVAPIRPVQKSPRRHGRRMAGWIASRAGLEPVMVSVARVAGA